MGKCQKCGNATGLSETLCIPCAAAARSGSSAPVSSDALSADSTAAHRSRITASRPAAENRPATSETWKVPAREGAIKTLRFVAWLDLICGAVCALGIWLSYSSIVGTAVGLAVLLQGVFLCALFLVFAGAPEDIAALRRHGSVAQ